MFLYNNLESWFIFCPDFCFAILQDCWFKKWLCWTFLKIKGMLLFSMSHTQFGMGVVGKFIYILHCLLPSDTLSAKVKGGAQWMTALLLSMVRRPLPTCKLLATSLWQEMSKIESMCLETFVVTLHCCDIKHMLLYLAKILVINWLEVKKERRKTVTTSKTKPNN